MIYCYVVKSKPHVVPKGLGPWKLILALPPAGWATAVFACEVRVVGLPSHPDEKEICLMFCLAHPLRASVSVWNTFG